VAVPVYLVSVVVTYEKLVDVLVSVKVNPEYFM